MHLNPLRAWDSDGKSSRQVDGKQTLWTLEAMIDRPSGFHSLPTARRGLSRGPGLTGRTKAQRALRQCRARLSCLSRSRSERQTAPRATDRPCRGSGRASGYHVEVLTAAHHLRIPPHKWLTVAPNSLLQAAAGVLALLPSHFSWTSCRRRC